MRISTKLLSFILAGTFTVASIVANPMSVSAKEYSYRVKISLGNNADAYFDESEVARLGENYKVNLDGSQIVISDLGYDTLLELDVDSLVKVNLDEATGHAKYYVAGLRVSGGDTIVTQASAGADGAMDIKASFDITSDEEYVVAYGVGSSIPYSVKYVDENGNELLSEDTYFAALGEKVLVPAKHVSGYYPDAYYRTASSGLKEDTVFTFIYKKPTITTTETVVDTVYETTTEYGEPVYEYQYANANRAAANGATNNPAGGQVQAAGGQNQAGNAQANQNAANQNAAGQNGEAVGDDSDDTTAISDDETPKDIIDIDEEIVAKAGGQGNMAERNMIMGITIAVVAAVILAVAIVVAIKKRKQINK